MSPLSALIHLQEAPPTFHLPLPWPPGGCSTNGQLQKFTDTLIPQVPTPTHLMSVTSISVLQRPHLLLPTSNSLPNPADSTSKPTPALSPYPLISNLQSQQGRKAFLNLLQLMSPVSPAPLLKWIVLPNQGPFFKNASFLSPPFHPILSLLTGMPSPRSTTPIPNHHSGFSARTTLPDFSCREASLCCLLVLDISTWAHTNLVLCSHFSLI